MRPTHKLLSCHYTLHCSYEVDIYEARPFIGGKVASFVDKNGNHIEVCVGFVMGCYIRFL